jgi:hypothetical protein
MDKMRVISFLFLIFRMRGRLLVNKSLQISVQFNFIENFVYRIYYPLESIILLLIPKFIRVYKCLIPKKYKRYQQDNHAVLGLRSPEDAINYLEYP